MKPILLFVLLTTAILSCNVDRHRAERRRLFTENSYDDEVIRRLSLYDSLKNVLVLYFDTILAYKNGHSGRPLRDDMYEHRFSFHPEWPVPPHADTGFDKKTASDMADMRNMPHYVYRQAVRICNQLGPNYINGFWLASDTSLTITVRDKVSEAADAVVAHELVWNKAYVYADDPEMLVRDSVIAPKWNYRVMVVEDTHF